ncbi:dolichyl-P-Man:Man(7)GlcNAc(2)-PP-dolichol alpha-1,6-mannosyltransferase [Quaeritorhiza haematococci]|nr:dolichyl-P-Man:Man(7)GlcNAc(2)-PP-dolichol alpha-1,6-mannosyltransferase [Quaeritorhiza haematococci]
MRRRTTTTTGGSDSGKSSGDKQAEHEKTGGSQLKSAAASPATRSFTEDKGSVRGVGAKDAKGTETTPKSKDQTKSQDQSSGFGSSTAAVRVPHLLWDGLTVGLIWTYIILCPYTKVEESFNLQATHDLLIHTPFNLTEYDHFQFPGVVPRTFTGPSLLWLFTLPLWGLHRVTLYVIVLLLGSPESIPQPEWLMFLSSKLVLQYLARGVLGALVGLSLAVLRRAVSRQFGRDAAGWFSVLTLCQFHLMFWASRTLPNVFGLIFVNWALACWMDGSSAKTVTKATGKGEGKNLAGAERAGGPTSSSSGSPRTSTPAASLGVKKDDEEELTMSQKNMIFLLAFTSIVFRSEVVVFAGPILIGELLRGSLKFNPTLSAGYSATSLCAALTIAIDSYFWAEPWLWPELRVFLFNTYQNRSSEWGTSPFHAYFTTLLPRIAPVSYVWVLYTGLRYGRDSSKVRRFLLPCLIFVFLYSFLPHKEWRFVFYVVPVFNAIAGYGIARTSSTIEKWWNRLLLVTVYLMVLASCCLSMVSLYISRFNYPGGEALYRLHELRLFTPPLDSQSSDIYVHLDVLTAMTGASRFGEIGATTGGLGGTWRYSKFENHTQPSEFVEAGYTHLITSNATFHLGAALKGASSSITHPQHKSPPSQHKADDDVAQGDVQRRELPPALGPTWHVVDVIMAYDGIKPSPREWAVHVFRVAKEIVVRPSLLLGAEWIQRIREMGVPKPALAPTLWILERNLE